MRYKPSSGELKRLPAFTLPRCRLSHDRRVYFHFYIPGHVMRAAPPFIEVCGTQLQNGFPPRPHHWYVCAFNPKSGLALAYLWHEDAASGQWVTLDLEGALTLRVGRWQMRNDRAWRPKRLSVAIREHLAANRRKRGDQ